MREKKLTFIIALLFFFSCGKKANNQENEFLQLNEYTQELYELSYTGLDSKYHFEGSIQIEGAGLHLKITTENLRKGYLFLVLHSASNCNKLGESQVMWNLNNDYVRNSVFENGFTLEEGRIKKSFDYYLLSRFLKTPKKDYFILKEGEKLSLEMRTLLFYYSNNTVIKPSELILMGCAEFHST